MTSIVVSFRSAQAQTHVVKKNEAVVRAVSVYEWVGPEGKATASRVVPVSIFVNGHLEDAGIYLARPVPLAVQTGTVFQLEQGGTLKGSLEMAYARHFVSNGTSQYDDGWTGYGAYKPKPAEVSSVGKKSGPLSQVVVSGGKGPHFSGAAESSETSSAKSAGDTPAKPVDRSTAAGAGTTVSASPAEDQDRASMRRRADAGSSDADPKDDAERPTLKKRSPAETKAAAKKKDQASVTNATELNDDADRPMLHRGKPASRMEEEDLPPLKGMPAAMHQMVAVSDAKDRPEHDFRKLWDSDADKAQVTAKMRALALARLAEYDRPSAGKTSLATNTVPTKTPRIGTAPRAARSIPAKAGTAHSAAVPAVTDETIAAYTLSYGGAATYVYSASAATPGAATRYVLLVAQQEPTGELHTALESVTDSLHLDRTPWMRLIDAVDADASNRASLLFELRAMTTRQFALYRVIGAEAENIFQTTTQD